MESTIRVKINNLDKSEQKTKEKIGAFQYEKIYNADIFKYQVQVLEFCNFDDFMIRTLQIFLVCPSIFAILSRVRVNKKTNVLKASTM